MNRPYETGDVGNVAQSSPAKVSTHVFAPEARWRLAGGGTTGTKPVEPPSPGGATDRSRSVAPPGLGGYLRSPPVVEPPGPSRLNLPAPEGRQTGLGLSPLRGWLDTYDRFRWFHHRLISGVPPG